MSNTIIYTKTDEAPMLATYSLLPILRSFLGTAGISLDLQDISLAGRIIARFPEFLNEDQRIPDYLSDLGDTVKTPEANVIKLPNISASIPQLTAAIAELQGQGYALPNYPEDPKTEEDKQIKARYDAIKGSAVNPVLREGNSDRRAPNAVKNYAKKNPHAMGEWSSDSKSHVAHMDGGDFFGSEQSVTIAKAGAVRIEHVDGAGTVTVMKDGLALQAGEVIDSSFMSMRALQDFLAAEIADAKAQDILFSIHLKATMMKVSDPIIFGAAVATFYAKLFDTFGAEFEALGVNPNNGLGDIENKIQALSGEKQAQFKAVLEEIYAENPEVAMANWREGKTNFHVPSDVIIDASMAAYLRWSGQMDAPNGKQKDTKFVIPDRCYAGIYQAVFDFCQEHGAFDVSQMGSVSNVGLMAQKAEEYGSHDKTFQISTDGLMRVVQGDEVLMSHEVEAGDIWRMCQVKDAPIKDWVGLAVRRARATGAAAVFWLNPERAHDAQIIKKVEQYLPEHETEGLQLLILPPVEAMKFSLDRCKDGLDTISVTGNVLRDYLTDLFPILELGTSAKMLSIVPLMNGGGLFETGAGGSAPKHVDQIVKENHLRWDSLGEFLAMTVSLEHLAEQHGNAKAQLFADCLDRAIGKVLDNGKSPLRKVKQLDNRGSHFYLAMYWAEELAAVDDAVLSSKFTGISTALSANEETIVSELNAVQGQEIELHGYYNPPEELLSRLMRPSATFNQILDSI